MNYIAKNLLKKYTSIEEAEKAILQAYDEIIRLETEIEIENIRLETEIEIEKLLRDQSNQYHIDCVSDLYDILGIEKDEIRYEWAYLSLLNMKNDYLKQKNIIEEYQNKNKGID